MVEVDLKNIIDKTLHFCYVYCIIRRRLACSRVDAFLVAVTFDFLRNI